jgi:hypothetical protein
MAGMWIWFSKYEVGTPSLYDPIVAGESFEGGIRWIVNRHGIRPIYEPEFVEAADSGLGPDNLLLGLTMGEAIRAYPIGLLAAREIVNDLVADTPVVVSWCPLCGTGTVHRRELDGHPVLFGNQGALWNNAMTWWDHETGSIWSQPLGRAIAGPLEGRSLELIPSTLTTWEAWLNSHPESLVLDGPVHPSGPNDLDAAVVVEINGETVAYPLPVLRELEVVEDTVGGEPIALVVNEQGLWSVRSRHDDGMREPAPIPAMTAFVDDFLVFWPEGRIYDPG